jgi:hypothetical protein
MVCLKFNRFHICNVSLSQYHHDKRSTSQHPGTEASLTLLLVSSGASWGLTQAWATLMTCSSFLGCSSTFAAKNKVVWEMICRNKDIKVGRYPGFHIVLHSSQDLQYYRLNAQGCAIKLGENAFWKSITRMIT